MAWDSGLIPPGLTVAQLSLETFGKAKESVCEAMPSGFPSNRTGDFSSENSLSFWHQQCLRLNASSPATFSLREPGTPSAMLVSDHSQCGALSHIAQPPNHVSDRCVSMRGIQGLYLSPSCKRVWEYALFFPVLFWYGRAPKMESYWHVGRICNDVAKIDRNLMQQLFSILNKKLYDLCF